MAMAEAIVDHGCHAIGIKDMAGLMKPRAATTLVSALREKYPDTVLHLHTHDSAGTAVATQLAAAAAGVDIADVCMDSMSGCTSQVCAALSCHEIVRRACAWTSRRAAARCKLDNLLLDVVVDLIGGLQTGFKGCAHDAPRAQHAASH